MAHTFLRLSLQSRLYGRVKSRPGYDAKNEEDLEIGGHISFTTLYLWILKSSDESQTFIWKYHASATIW